jgi:hypothetical protein
VHFIDARMALSGSLLLLFVLGWLCQEGCIPLFFMGFSRKLDLHRLHLLQFGDQEGLRGLWITLLELLKTKTGIIDVSKGTGTANTSLVYHAGRIMALHEGDLPYQVSMGEGVGWGGNMSEQPVRGMGNVTVSMLLRVGGSCALL